MVKKVLLVLARTCWLVVCSRSLLHVRCLEAEENVLVEGTRFTRRAGGDVLLQLDVTSHDGRALKLQLYREQVICIASNRIVVAAIDSEQRRMQVESRRELNEALRDFCEKHYITMRTSDTTAAAVPSASVTASLHSHLRVGSNQTSTHDCVGTTCNKKKCLYMSLQTVLQMC